MKIRLKQLSILAALAAISINAADPTGNWIWITPGRNGLSARESILHVKREGSSLTGAISAPGAEGKPIDTPISEGKVNGDEISFVVIRKGDTATITNRYSGTVAADKIAGKIEFTRDGEVRSRNWEAKNAGARSEAAAVPPPKPGYSEQGYKIVNETKYKELSVDDAAKYIETHPNAVILDLRPPAAYAKGHLPNAKNLDVTDDEHYKEYLKPLPKDKQYVIHSVVGHYRTVRALEYFEANGYPDVVAIDGGYAAWAAAGKPTVQ